MKEKPFLNPQTQAIHAGELHDTQFGSTIPHITLSNTFLVDPDISFSAENLADKNPFVYSRWGNPNADILERKIAILEGGEAGLAFSSGMAAVTGLMFHKLKAGDRILVSDIAYAGVREFGNGLLKAYGIIVEPVNISDLQAVKKALQQPCKMLFLETPCNPIVRLTNIQAVSDIAHKHGAEVAVDSTFATPFATKPLGHGADFVIHALTKYIGGHGDALGGIVIGKQEEIQALRVNVGIHLGAVINPFAAWLINRGIATLPLRIKAHSENAMEVAQFLEAHSKVEKVVYPGLPSHPQHELAKTQMKLFSGMLTFQAKNPLVLASRMSKKLRIFHYAVSLGHHKSLIFYIPTEEIQKSSFRLMEKNLEAYRDYAGNGIFRVSVGLEDPKDLCRDLDEVL